MKNAKRTVLSVAMTAGVLGSSAISTPSFACAVDPYLTSVCALAASRNRSFDSYVPANGAQLPISQYQAVYSLIGTTYGGDGVSNFKLPNLSGRVIVGSGQYSDAYGPKSYTAGQTGGLVGASLTTANLPPHVHTLTTVAAPATNGVLVSFDSTKIGATTSLSGLTTTTDLSKVAFTSSSSSLSIKALSTNGSNPAPSSTSYLAKSSFATAAIYTTTLPDTVMAPGSVVGTVSGTLTGTAPGTVSGGTASTSVTVQPGAVTVGGQTNATGSGASFSIMSPYLVMNYFFATQGTYPIFDN